MNILIPIDIEDEVRKALVPYFANVVAGDLPPNFPTPILRVRQTGGGTANTIDNFNVSIDARAETDVGARIRRPMPYGEREHINVKRRRKYKPAIA